MHMKTLATSALSLTLLLLSACAHAVDLKEVEQKLTTTGAEGWIHGASPSQGLYVFTYRNPKDFFDFVEMSLVSRKSEITKQLETLNRHDKVLVKGVFLDNPSPQKHIDISSIEVTKKYTSPYPVPAYEHEARLPDELLNKTSGLFLVHAIAGDGHILVVEYKDSIVPIFVKNGDLAKNLYRGDLVQLNFAVQEYPDRPTHLYLDESNPKALQIVESIRSKHGKPGAVEGTLVLFSKSPEIMFNVFAVLEPLPEGLNRQYTLVNFDDPDTFSKIRAKLQAAWDKYPGEYTNGRNKLLSKRIRVKATGTFNEIDPSQANPQILLKTVDSVEITEPLR